MQQEKMYLQIIEEIKLNEPLDIYLEQISDLITTSLSFNQPQLSYQYYYQTVELICQCSLENELYCFIHNVLTQIFQTMIDQSLKIDELESLYKYFLEQLKSLKQMIQILSDLFLYFEQTYLFGTEYETLENLILQLLRNEINKNPTIMERISQYISDQLNIQRRKLLNEQMQEEFSSIEEFKQILDFMDIMNYIKKENPKSFECIFFQYSLAYFSQLKEELKAFKLEDKIQMIYGAQLTEKFLVKKLLHEKFGNNLKNEFKLIVIEPQINYLLDCFSLFQEDKYRLISQMYQILEENGNLNKFRKNIYLFIEQEGEKILKQDYNVFQIEAILQLREKIEKMNFKIFDNDQKILDIEHQAFTDFVSSRVNTLTELFTQYLDGKLTKKGKAIKDEHNLFKDIDRSLNLLRYFTASDIFETFFTQRLTRRILLDFSYSFELEYEIFSKLQTTFGSQYTRRSEQVMNDVSTSKKQTTDFLCKFTPSIDFQVTTIQLNSWSLQRNVFNYKMDPFYSLQNMFEEFYVSQNPQTKLEWQFDCSTCLLEGKFNQQKYKIQVSLMQSLILLLFNHENEQSLSSIVFYLRSMSKITDQEREKSGLLQDFLQEEVVKSLIALSNMKEDSSLLLKKGDLKSLSQNEFFALNTQFSNKKKFIKVNQIQKKETKKEIEETTSNILHERTFMIDAALVKLMKNLKTADLNEIMQKVQDMLKIPLKTQDIKIQIQQLIKRDYLIRDEEQINLFHYQA